MTKLLELDLDDLYTCGYYYTSFDVGGAGHYIHIVPEDKEMFLDAFAKKWREMAAERLKEVEVDWYDDQRTTQSTT